MGFCCSAAAIRSGGQDCTTLPERQIGEKIALAGIVDRDRWPGLQCIGMVECACEVDGETSAERGYYIPSLEGDAEQFGAIMHGAAGASKIAPHWRLDVAFREDERGTRKHHGPADIAMQRHLALNFLHQKATCKRGIKTSRPKAGSDENCLFKVPALAR